MAIIRKSGKHLYVQVYDPQTQGTSHIPTDIPNTPDGYSKVKALIKIGYYKAKPLITFTLDMDILQAQDYYFSQVQLSPKTIDGRKLALRWWIQLCGVKRLNKYNDKDYQTFIEALSDRSKNTLAIYTSELHSFFQWYVNKKALSANIISITPRELKDPRIIPQSDLTKLLAYLYQKEDKRHFAFIFFLLNAGCRKSDAIALPWSSVDWGNKIIYIKNIKKNRNYSIPLTNMLSEALQLMQGRFEPRVFGYANITSLEFYWKAQVKVFGSNKYTMHELRKTFITTQLQRGFDMDTVKKLVNHQELETISKYYNVAVVENYRERLNKNDTVYGNIYEKVMERCENKSERRDLNPRPPEPHSGTLPGCATFRLDYIIDNKYSKNNFTSLRSFLTENFSFLFSL